MAFTVYDGLYAYAKSANSGLYHGCRTSIFNNPADQIYTPKGNITKVRQYESGKAGTYNKSTGWTQDYGSGTGVEWKDYQAPYDRAKVLRVDAVDELASFANGMKSSIELLNEDFLNNQISGEIDATNIAKFYSRVAAANRHVNTESGYGVDKNNIMDTVIGLQQNIFNSGYNGMSVLFMRASVYGNFKKALIANYGIAYMMASKTMTVRVNTGLNGLGEDGDGGISVNVDVNIFDKFIVVEMPDDRMYTKITLYDGYSAGQTDGGYVPDRDDDGFADIELLAIPLPAAFTNTRYMVDNYLVPAAMPGVGSSEIDLRKLNQQMFGNVEVGFAGINQKANAFEYDIRVIYGGDVFDNRARNCFAVTGVVGDQTVDSIVVTGAGGASTISTNDGTLQLTATVLPETATDKNVVWTSTDTQKATVNSTGLVTAVANGTVKIKATAHDGSGTVGELELTISNQT